MKRTQRFIIGLLAAGITFATLTATVGTDHWRRGYFHREYNHYHHGDHPDWHDWKKPDGKADSTTQ